MGTGRQFQEGTKYVRGKIPAGYYGTGRPPAPFKTYPGAPTVPLPPPATEGGMPLWEALGTRRSSRDYADGHLLLEELSQLLWGATGATGACNGLVLRTAPSAGALFPVETYVEARDVAGISGGIYHYGVREHALSLVRESDLSAELAGAALGQEMVAGAGAVFLWTAVFGRSAVKYLERAWRYVYLDAAHVAQNLLLAATALGLSACPIAALYDDEVNEILGVDGTEESILYMASVGRSADTPVR